jgi:hypothetical protein
VLDFFFIAAKLEKDLRFKDSVIPQNYQRTFIKGRGWKKTGFEAVKKELMMPCVLSTSPLIPQHWG